MIWPRACHTLRRLPASRLWFSVGTSHKHVVAHSYGSNRSSPSIARATYDAGSAPDIFVVRGQHHLGKMMETMGCEDICARHATMKMSTARQQHFCFFFPFGRVGSAKGGPLAMDGTPEDTTPSPTRPAWVKREKLFLQAKIMETSLAAQAS